jgi:hypothetical protein
MLRFFKPGFLLLLCLPLCGCFLATSDSRITSEYANTVKTVGVVSLLASNPKISFLSTSAMDSRFSSAVLEGWNSDALVHATLLPRLERKGYTVRAMTRNSELAAAQAEDWRAPQGDSVAEAIYAAGAAGNFDMVVVVQAQVREDFVTDTNQKVRAFGLQKAFDTEPFLYTTVYVEAYEIKRRFVVGRAEGNQIAAAPAGLWNPIFETTADEYPLTGSGAQILVDALAAQLTTAVGVAAQEAGL